jgi:hypothetical protein
MGRERVLPSKVVYEKDEIAINELDEEISSAFQTLMVYQNKSNLLSFLAEVQPGRLLANRKFLSSGWQKEGYYYSFEPFSDVEELKLPTLIAGHMIQIEQRTALQNLVTDWLERVKRRRYIDAERT